MKPYADTNFFTCSYLGLPGSEVAESLFEKALHSAAGPIPITWLHRLELSNALERLFLKREIAVSIAFRPNSLRRLMPSFSKLRTMESTFMK